MYGGETTGIVSLEAVVADAYDLIKKVLLQLVWLAGLNVDVIHPLRATS